MYERRIFVVLWLKYKQLIEHFKMFYNAAKECGSKTITIDFGNTFYENERGLEKYIYSS